MTYYGNHECKVLFETGTHALIEIFVDAACVYGGSWDEPPEYEPVSTHIMVPKDMILNEKITIDSVSQKATEILNEARNEVKDIIDEGKAEAREIVADARRQVKEIESRVKRYKDHGLLEYLNYLDGKYDWVVATTSYSCKIIHVDDLRTQERNGDGHLVAISFRDKKYAERNSSALRFNSYGDGSGSWQNCRGFANRADAESYVVEQIECGNIKPSAVNKSQGCESITCPKLEAYKEELRQSSAESRKKEIAKLESQLEKLKNPGDDDGFPF